MLNLRVFKQNLRSSLKKVLCGGVSCPPTTIPTSKAPQSLEHPQGCDRRFAVTIFQRSACSYPRSMVRRQLKPGQVIL